MVGRTELADVDQGSRLDWANRAYDEFVRGLQPEVAAALPRSRRDTSVILYGKAREGKSTLALALLGLRAEAFAEVEDVLQAGLPVGEPVTAAPIRYGAAAGEDWQWRSGAIEPWRRGPAGDLQRFLRDVRARVQAQTWDPGRVVYLNLPRRYLDDDGLALRILDLPGREPKHDNERRFVASRLHPVWIEAADVIVLVGQAAQLGFLTSADVGDPSLRSWHCATERFRVVLTKTYTDMTVLRETESDPESMCPRKMRDYALKMMRNPDILLPETPPATWLYPLEYGRSWRTRLRLPEITDEVRNAVVTCRDAILRELRADLRAASAPERRFRGAYQAGRIADEIRAARERRLDDHRQSLAARRAVAETVEAQRRDIADRCAEALNRSQRLLDAVQEAATSGRRLTVDATATVEKLDRRALGGLRREFEERFATTWSIWHSSANRALYPHLPVRSAGDPLGDNHVAERVHEIVKAGVRTSPIGSLRRRRDKLHKAAQLTADELTALLRERAVAELRPIEVQLVAAVAENTARLAAAQGRVSSATERVAEALSQVEQAEENGRQERARLAEAVVAAHGFPELLTAHFEAHCQRCVAAVEQAHDKVERLIAALTLLDGARLYDAVRGGG